MSIEIVPLAGALGAEIRGVDLARIDDATFGEVNTALLDYGMIYFRDQSITPDQQLALAQRWGEVHHHPYLRGLPDRPEIIEIVREADDRASFGDSWHTDQIFTPVPAMGTMLYAKVMPPVGGDTVFANLYKAYETLSPGMQKLAARLRTVSVYDKGKPRAAKMSAKVEQEKTPVPAIHPLVRVHPETGRPALYINDTNTTRWFEGLSEAESRPLLEFLLAHAIQHENTARLRWEVGTLAVWDNRCMLHKALNDYQGHRRVMHRVTIKGSPTVGLDEAPARAA